MKMEIRPCFVLIFDIFGFSHFFIRKKEIGENIESLLYVFNNNKRSQQRDRTQIAA